MKIRKVFAVALIAAICLSLYFVYAPASAEDLALTAQDGLCVHHPEHTAECGYYLETGENTCSHVHDDICGYVAPVDAQPCNHTHDASCGYVEAREEVPCDKGCTDQDGDGVIDHVEGCAYQPAVADQPCNHTHDETCGYAEAVEGQACTHVHDETCGYVDPSQTGVCVYAQAGCPYCVVDWQWSDPQGFLTQEADGSWSMDMPGVSASYPVSASALQSFLPTEIATRMDNDTMPALAIAWDLTAIPADGATSGDYLLQAYLADPTYALTDAAAPLQVTLRLGGAETYELVMPNGDPPYQEHIVTGVSPAGTTINLFDYWITSQADSDDGQNTTDDFLSKGINNEHVLLFGKGMNGDTFTIGEWNEWTESNAPYPNIVASKLGDDGYPRLNLTIDANSALTSRDGTESLAYLFNPNVESAGKESFENVKGLLQVDSNGYYYYDSTENYAVYYNETNSFTLYEFPGVKPGGSSPVGQFFPFNQATANAEKEEHNGASYNLMNKAYSTDSSINHYFGMHMSTRFIQQFGGHVSAADGAEAVTYEFSGDDDVWIFIDGTLVADLGGIHDAASVKIDFSTGQIWINGTLKNKTLGSLLNTGSDTLPDNTYHTLDFFYLERGNVDSNLKLRYNLVTIPESSVIKVDQVGDPVPDAVFSLYAADDQSKPIATGVTNNNGEFVFKDEEGFPITIADLYKKYGQYKGNQLILKETKTPDGYRTNGVIYLYFQKTANGEVLLLSDSIWDKGAYAMSKVTATIKENPIQLLKLATGNEVVDTVQLNPADRPLMFAVVYQRQDDDSWLPVYGDPLNGWKVASNNTWNSVLMAARENPYIFELASSGAYQVEVSNLPGDIRTYYYVCEPEEQDNAQYTIAYYYTEASSLAGATAENTWRISSDQDELDRVFSVNLYVSNIKNRLLVQKVNEEGEVITDHSFQFALYHKDDVKVDGDGNVVSVTGQPYDQLTTSDTTSIDGFHGGGIFPTAGKVLANGEYYLVETDAPYGYKKSEKATHIVVDHTGVYADAGEKDDGIEVLRGVGSIIHSMVQFAADDDVDITLNHIKAALAGAEFNTFNENGSFVIGSPDWSSSDVLHLQYANAHEMLDYGLTDGTEVGTLDELTIETDAGWSKLLIRQCETHKSTGSGAWQNLGDQDLTNLFSGTVTVRVTNERVGNLKITKTVTVEQGQTAPEGAEFTFKLHNQKDGTPISGTFNTLNQNNVPDTITFNNGETSLKLKGGESLTILGLPYGSYYSIQEEPVPGYNVSSSTNDGEYKEGISTDGNIPHSTTDEDGKAEVVAFTNHYDGQARASLTGVKTLLGRNLEVDDSFTFTLEAYDEVTKKAIEKKQIILPEKTSYVLTNVQGTNKADFSFDSIVFETGTEDTVCYAFAIQEVVRSDATDDISNGIRYDTHIAIARVTVSYNHDTKKWEASVTYDNQGASAEDVAITDKAAFTNVGAYDLTIAKKVTGEMGDRDKLFTFQIQLKESDGSTLTGEFDYTGGVMEGMAGITAPKPGTLQLENGAADFTLSHGQTITIHGLPVGTKYTITEPDAQEDGYTVTPKGDVTCYLDGHCVGNLKQETTVTFINSKGTAVPTGIRLDALPWLLALLCGLAGCTALCVTGKTRRRKGGCGRTHG